MLPNTCINSRCGTQVCQVYGLIITCRWSRCTALWETLPTASIELGEFIQIIRPPETVVPDGLMFYCWCFYSTLPLYISELPPPIAVKLWHMIRNVCTWTTKVPKFGPPRQTVWGQLFFFAFRPKISELTRPIAVKLCQMIGNRWSFKS